MGRPGTKITSFPTPQHHTTPLPGGLSTSPPTVLPAPLPLQPQNIGMPTVDTEPVSFPPETTIDELIELRRIVGKNDPKYWAAFDEIQRKRDIIFDAHVKSLCKASQDNTIALYTVNKKKVPETAGKPFASD